MGNWPKCWPTWTHLPSFNCASFVSCIQSSVFHLLSAVFCLYFGLLVFVEHIKVTRVAFDLQFMQLELPNLVNFTCSVRNLCLLLVIWVQWCSVVQLWCCVVRAFLLCKCTFTFYSDLHINKWHLTLPGYAKIIFK